MNNMIVKIYKPGRKVTQAAHSMDDWVVDFSSEINAEFSALMSWTKGGSFKKSVTFSSMQSAIDYVEGLGLKYKLIKPNKKKIVPKSYSDNFVSKF